MKRRLLGLTAFWLCCCLLAGCAAVQYSQQMETLPAMPQQGQEIVPDTDTTTQNSTRQLYGSAGLLAFPTALVSIYLNEANGAQWDEDMIAQSRQELATAVEWITQQCEAYHAAPVLYYDDGSEDNGLFYELTVDYTFASGQEEEREEYYDQIDALCEYLDTEELYQKYGTSSIGFLIFLPVDGCAFTMVHNQEDGAQYCWEYSTLYAYDCNGDPGTYDGPSTYAHEILHLFGAPDLYEDSADYYVTEELLDFVNQNWPDSIMADTYEPDGSISYDAIHKELDGVTAYRLGLCSGFEGIEQFPGVTADQPGTFSTGAQPQQEELPAEAV